jgi:hypothetical protein
MFAVLIGRFLQTFRKIVVPSSGPIGHEAVDCFTIYRLIWRHTKNRVVRNVAVGSLRLVLLIPALLLVFFTSAGRQIPLARSSWRQDLWKHVLRLSSWLNKYSATKQLTHCHQRTIFAVTGAEGKGAGVDAVCACTHLSAECLNRQASKFVSLWSLKIRLALQFFFYQRFKANLSFQPKQAILQCAVISVPVNYKLCRSALLVNVWQQQIALLAVLYDVTRLSFNCQNYSIIDFIGSLCVGQSVSKLCSFVSYLPYIILAFIFNGVQMVRSALRTLQQFKD